MAANDAIRVHPSALIEQGVAIGAGTAVWDSVHIRGPGTSLGRECIIGEKTYLAPGVVIGDRVKVNAFVYLCSGVTIEDGVMLAAGVTFTNDRFPRATTADLSTLRPSEIDEHTLETVIGRGATVGARAVIGPGLAVGPFALVGMGSVVTVSVPAYGLVVGNPARLIGRVCRCGQPWWRSGDPDPTEAACGACGRRYALNGTEVRELDP